MQNFEFEYDVNLEDVRSSLGVRSLVGYVIRVTTLLHDYFMGETREGYIETRIIRAQLKFYFAGTKTAVFKPEMPFEGHINVMYDDHQPLSEEKLAGATLILRPVATGANGQVRTLSEIIVPPKGEYRTNVESEDENQKYQNWMEQQAEDDEFSQFRTKGIYRFQVC